MNGQVGDNEYISTVTEAAKIILDMDWHGYKDFIWRSMMNLNFCDPDYLVILKCSIRLSKSTEFLFFWNRVFTRDSLIGKIFVSPVKVIKQIVGDLDVWPWAARCERGLFGNTIGEPDHVSGIVVLKSNGGTQLNSIVIHCQMDKKLCRNNFGICKSFGGHSGPGCCSTK